MKIIHTGDWHIGKLVQGIHMTKDQKHIMDELVGILERENPDVLLISGDIYDRSIPPVEAVELLDEVFSRILVDMEIPIIAVAGNHDSPDRINFASKILRDNGLYMRGRIEGFEKPVSMEDEHGRVNFYAVPYADPAVVRSVLGDEAIRSHDDAMKVITGRIYDEMDKNERNIFIGHAFVTWMREEGEEEPQTSDSERPLSIGGSEHVDVSRFEGFDYVALGHLHRPQRVKSENIRYSGSIMKYSFSEHMHKKSVTIVEIDGEGNVETRFEPLRPLRDMRVIRGELDELLSENVYSLANTDDYVMAVLSDRGALVDPMARLRSVYPNALKIEREEFEREAGDERSFASEDFEKKDPIELFGEFYESMSGARFDGEKKEELIEMVKDIDMEGGIS